MTNPDSSPRRFGELDSLRGISAVLIMVFHYTEALHNRTPSFPIIDLGHVAVCIFFIISGFVISMTAERHTVRGFIRNRFIRLYPVYWLCLALSLIVPPLLGDPERFSLGQIAANATMGQTFLFVRSVDPVYWTLEVELSFYATVAVLLAVGWLKHTERLALVGLVLFFAVNFHRSGWDPNWPTLEKVILMPFIITGFYAQGPLFLAGMLFHRVKQSGYTPGRTVLLVLCALAQFIPYEPRIAFGLILILGLFGWIAVFPVPALTHPALRFLGAISYPFYLVHKKIGCAILLFLAGTLPAVPSILITTAIVLTLASVIHLKFEKPIMRRFRQPAEGGTRQMAVRMSPP